MTKFTDKAKTNVGIRKDKNYFENGSIYDQNFEWQVVAQTHFKLIESINIVDGYSKTKGFLIFQYVWMSFDVRLRTIDPFLHTLISFIDLRDQIPFEFNFRY